MVFVFADEALVFTVLDINDARLNISNGELHKAIPIPILMCSPVMHCCALPMHAEMPKF